MSDLSDIASKAAEKPVDKSWIPEAYRDKIDVANIEDLAKGYIEAKSQKAFSKPGKDSKPEDVIAYRKAIGVPEKKEDYSSIFTKEGKLTVDKNYADFMTDIAFEAGVTPEALEVIHGKFAQLGNANKLSMEQDLKKKQDECVSALKYKYGSEYESNMKRAQDAVGKLGGEGVYSELEKTGALNNPKIVDLLVSIGKEIGESDVLKGKTSQVGNKALTARDVIAQRLALDTKK